MTRTKLGLVGSHAASAASPPLWNAVLHAIGYDDWVYEPLEAATGELDEVERRLRSGEFKAVNVTMPHKGWAAEVADRRSAHVEASQVANFLIPAAGQLTAFNTDMTAVELLVGEHPVEEVALLGCGGAAHGLIFTIGHRARRVIASDIDAAAAAQLATEVRALGCEVEVVDWAERAAHVSAADVIVNATPVGKRIGDAPAWDTGTPKPDALVYDFAYVAGRPTSTEQECERLGLHLINGWAHWYEQAAAMVDPLGLPPAARDALAAEVTREGGVIRRGGVPAPRSDAPA